MSISSKIRIVFVCVENSNRSQMAEAFARVAGGSGVTAMSAGSCPSGRINPRAIASMAKLGYDLSTHTSKSVADLDGIPFDAVITMGCGDSCPRLLATHREDWQIPDPRELEPEQFDAVRDLIHEKVKELLSSFSTPAQHYSN